ncbi:hypothetical protein GGR53DRAFT_152200 [Hypoxylon sp. FL1150]|nr:hypothetical protein GGR53DRAFT_152200 [Hypoxylon sp. FL1150]
MAANPRRKPSAFLQSFYGFLQTVFALLVFAIFVIAWAVETGTISLPQWAKAWNNATPEEVTTYTAVLVPSVSVLFLLFFFAGFLMMRKERRQFSNNGVV